jgi:hypothetical protein
MCFTFSFEFEHAAQPADLSSKVLRETTALAREHVRTRICFIFNFGLVHALHEISFWFATSLFYIGMACGWTVGFDCCLCSTAYPPGTPNARGTPIVASACLCDASGIVSVVNPDLGGPQDASAGPG